MSASIDVERAGQVAYVTINNPSKRNAMGQAMWIAMGDALLALASDSQLRCIVLRGAGETAFGSGADIEEFAAIRSSKDKAIGFARHGHRAMHALRDCPIPTVAAIRGICAGGGLELAAYCDMRIATPDSRFGVPIARLGAVLAYPELQGLVQLAGPTVALELLLEGRLFNAQEALQRGLLNRVVPAADFDTEIAQTVARIAANAPLSARWHKRFIARLRDPAALSQSELDEGYACFDTEDYRIGYASFLAKTTPEFQGK